MAQVVGSQVKLNNGQTVTPQTGGWYDGEQYWNGTLGTPGNFNTQNNQAGQQGSAYVAPQDQAYVNQQRSNQGLAPSPTTSAPAPAPTSVPTGTSGGSAPTTGSLTPPTFDLVGATNAAYNTPEITSANQAITDSQTELNTKQQDLANAQANINDNPFFSEATRVGKSQQLTQQANADMTVTQNKITEQQNTLAGLKSDAAIKVNAAQGQYNINEQAYKDTLSQFDTILQAGGLTYADPNTLASYATATGIPYSELQSIQQTQQQSNIKTSLVTSDNGTVSVINSATGAIISQTQPGVGTTQKASAPSAASTATNKNKQLGSALGNMTSTIQPYLGSDGLMAPSDWANALQAWIAQGFNESDFISNFAQLTNSTQQYQGLGQGKTTPSSSSPNIFQSISNTIHSIGL